MPKARITENIEIAEEQSYESIRFIGCHFVGYGFVKFFNCEFIDCLCSMQRSRSRFQFVNCCVNGRSWPLALIEGQG